MITREQLLQQFNDFANEAYVQYERITGTRIPRDGNGNFIAHNNAIDAFRHAYVSGKFASIYGSAFADALGIINELEHKNDAKERNMDLWNNNIGRQYGFKDISSDELADKIKRALDNGELIKDLQDERKYPYNDNLSGYLESIIDSLESDLRVILDDYIESIKSLLNSLISDTLTIGDTIQSSFNWMFAAEQTSQARRVDPLSLDLEGDGVELLNVNNSSVFFDLDLVQVASLEEANDIKNNPNNANYNPNAVIHTSNNIDAAGNITPTYYIGDGLKEQVGWIKSDDGILTLDKNNNNSIDNILELFGKVDKTGTEELREYDLNNATNQNNIADGIIDQKDAIFSQLKIWQDLNQNGLTQEGELKKLTDLNITSISR
jgi:hypothetical protein